MNTEMTEASQAAYKKLLGTLESELTSIARCHEADQIFDQMAAITRQLAPKVLAMHLSFNGDKTVEELEATLVRIQEQAKCDASMALMNAIAKSLKGEI